MHSIPEKISVVETDAVNMLGTAVVAILFGVLLQGMGERGEPLLRVFGVLFDILMKVVFKLYQ